MRHPTKSHTLNKRASSWPLALFLHQGCAKRDVMEAGKTCKIAQVDQGDQSLSTIQLDESNSKWVLQDCFPGRKIELTVKTVQDEMFTELTQAEQADNTEVKNLAVGMYKAVRHTTRAPVPQSAHNRSTLHVCPSSRWLDGRS